MGAERRTRVRTEVLRLQRDALRKLGLGSRVAGVKLRSDRGGQSTRTMFKRGGVKDTTTDKKTFSPRTDEETVETISGPREGCGGDSMRKKKLKVLRTHRGESREAKTNRRFQPSREINPRALQWNSGRS